MRHMEFQEYPDTRPGSFAPSSSDVTQRAPAVNRQARGVSLRTRQVFVRKTDWLLLTVFPVNGMNGYE